MKKLFFLFVILCISGCERPLFVEHNSITKYTTDKYADKLLKYQIKAIKCYTDLDGKTKVIYSLDRADNAFPATIRIIYTNKQFNVYFDHDYFNIPKSQLIEDMDKCMEVLDSLIESNSTWK